MKREIFVFVARPGTSGRKNVWVNKRDMGAHIHIRPVSGVDSASGNPDPNLWLERPCRNGYEAD